jgi:hypothetical protein
MELSRTIAVIAVVLGVVIAAGFAIGEDRLSSERDRFEQACNSALDSEADRTSCRAAYRAL